MIAMKSMTKYLFLLMGLLIVVACASDEESNGVLPPGTPVTVKFKVDTYDGPMATRAWDGKTHAATTGEGMQSWVVIVVNNGNDAEQGKVERIFVKENVGDWTTDEVANETEAEVLTGQKRIYSFANIAPADLETALGLEAGAIAEEGTLVEQELDHDAVLAATFQPMGNNWTPVIDGEDQVGIPMSNWQDIEINRDNGTHTLYVCRMIAKLEFRFENGTGKPLTVKDFSINDITSNSSPISLMPSLQVPLASGQTMTPVLPDDRATETAHLFGQDNENSYTIPVGGKWTQTLYVNESEVSATSRYGLFFLTLNAEGEEQYRYALLNNENENWTYISRNDYRIIPIFVEDYRLDLVPVDFPPIGVYPAAVKEEDGVFTCTFHAKGDFELIPVVTKYSTGEQLPYGTGEGCWEYVTDSWTAPTETLTGEVNNAAAIYQDNTLPVWDAEQHIISGTFGETKGEAYHEMQVKIHKGGGVSDRILTYRVWVIR